MLVQELPPTAGVAKKKKVYLFKRYTIVLSYYHIDLSFEYFARISKEQEQ